jgi:photosystem II stability/assembly factor-like uncharacterized protein
VILFLSLLFTAVDCSVSGHNFNTSVYKMRKVSSLFFLLCLFSFVRTANAQTTWESGYGPMRVFGQCIAFGPTNYVYDGTSGTGIRVSTDDGTSWAPQRSYDFLRAIVTTSSGTILGGTSGFGILRAADNGLNWKSLAIGHGGGSTDTEQVNSLLSVGGGVVLAGTYAGLSRSTDEGQTWARRPIGSGKVGVTAMVRLRDGLILAIVNGSQLFISADAGMNWGQVKPTTGPGAVNCFALLRDGRVVAGSQKGSYISSDDGSSWTPLSSGLANASVWSFAVDSSGGLFAGCSPGGLRRSLDGGSTWQTIFDDTTGMYSTCVAVAPNGEIFYSAIADFYASKDQGATWRQCGGMQAERTEALAVGPEGTLYGGTYTDGVYASTDNGKYWRHSGMVNTGVAGLTTDLAGRVYAADFSFYAAAVSSDGARTWYYGKMQFTFNQYYCIALSNNNIYVGGGAIQRSTDHGVSFQNVAPFETIGALFAIQSGEVFAGTAKGIYRSDAIGNNFRLVDSVLNPIRAISQTKRGSLIAGGDHGVRRSTDGGLTWQASDSTLKRLIILTFTVAKNGDIFLGSDSGVYRSHDDGRTWTSDSMGIGQRPVHVMAVDSVGYIYAAAEFSGVYRSAQPLKASVSASIVDVSAMRLMPLFPNPANDQTTIEVDIARSEPLTIAIYDLLGKKIATIYNGIPRTERVSANWLTNNVAPGIYYCRATTPSAVETRMIQVIR